MLRRGAARRGAHPDLKHLTGLLRGLRGIVRYSYGDRISRTGDVRFEDIFFLYTLV